MADRGRNLGLSLPRRWVNDLLHFSKKVPTVAGERYLNIKAMIELRRKTPRPPSWSSIMIKAFAMASARIPELRRSYMPYPWPHLYEAPYSVAAIVFHREYLNENAAFIAPLLHPELRTLDEIDQKTAALRNDPVEAHGALRRLIRVSRYPTPIRRMLWSMGMYASGYYRVRNFGTFAINSLAAMRGKMLQTCTPITSHLYYGVPEKNGQILMQFGFDHRVFDAYILVKANSEIESLLNHELITELQTLREKRLASA